ncbi:hypothetical protein [uncultured Polaribacter sp.]|uniref:hypothetical protein n=1 Tax=uncultured Polaribacter sp. TaxID=174711 RepID=UPI00260D4778|nr:hypothetical protein [uncultured Polaribacter sp.]
MTEEDIYLVIAAVFIKIDKKISNLGSKTEAAKEILGKIPAESKLTKRTLVNYYNYYILNTGKPQSPSNETLIILINYYSENNYKSISDAFHYFKENIAHQKETIAKNIPCFNIKKPNISAQNLNETQEKKEQNSTNLTILIEKNTTQFYSIVLAIVAVSICALYFFNKKGDTNIDVGGVQVNNNFKQIIPTKETQFFSKKNNIPLVWYTNYNNKLVYFNANGHHPISGKQLQPITQEVVKKYFLEKLPIKNNSLFKKTKVKIESIFNQSITNNKNPNSMSIFIFDGHQKLENIFTTQLKKEFTSKGYNITATLIKPSKLSLKVIEHLHMHNFSYFKEDIKDYTRFICTGKVNYTFSKNKINTDLFTCRLQINYTVVSTETNEVIDNYSNLLIGNGFSKATAKNNTIKKFKL